MMNIEIGLAAAIVGVVYSVVLSSDYTPLNRWFLMLAIMRDRSGRCDLLSVLSFGSSRSKQPV